MVSRFLSDLHPIVEDKARDWLAVCKSEGLDILVTSTLRTFAEQDFLYNKVPSVTNAKAGYSYHNYGLALDFCPLINGKCAWTRNDLFF